MTQKISDYFEIESYEVRFLQDNPITVCVIRSLTNRSQKYVGIAVCHPTDIFDEATGRHKALKDAINDSKSFELLSPITTFSTCSAIMSFGARAAYILPVKEIQRAYWEHYKESE